MLELNDLEHLKRFLLDIDGLKQVERVSYIRAGGRRENTAEHSWHVVIAAWTLARHASVPCSIEKVLKLAAAHDLCELDHGDVCIHTGDSDERVRMERQCVTRLMTDYGDLFDELEVLWQEYEAGESTEAKLVRAADRLLPFLLNLATEGLTWRERGISKSQVLKLYAPLDADFPQLVEWIGRQVKRAVEAGWLRDA